MNTSVRIENGEGEHMGEGVFVILQQSEEGPQSVVVTADDLRRLLDDLR